jgi:HAD superfamily hydrolase (TIGR01509 family)
LIVFDCDGVLVDSEPSANRVFAEALSELGLALDYDEVCATFVGLSMSGCIEIVEERLGRRVPSEFAANVRERTLEAFRQELHPVPGVREVVDGLDRPYCVASSGELEKMRFTLGMTGLLSSFEGRMFSASQVPRGKPHPDLFLFAAREMSAAPETCIVVEDSVPGVLAARAAEMPVLGFAARSDPERLSCAGARVFRQMHELPALLKSSPDF